MSCNLVLASARTGSFRFRRHGWTGAHMNHVGHESSFRRSWFRSSGLRRQRMASRLFEFAFRSFLRDAHSPAIFATQVATTSWMSTREGTHVVIGVSRLHGSDAHVCIHLKGPFYSFTLICMGVVFSFLSCFSFLCSSFVCMRCFAGHT